MLHHPPVVTPPAATPKVIIIEEEEHPVEMVPKKEAPKELEIITSEDKPELLQPRLFTALMRDHEESSSRMFDDFDDLDDLTEVDYDVDEWFPEDGSHDRDRIIKSRS
jgi:hypothetical protein